MDVVVANVTNETDHIHVTFAVYWHQGQKHSFDKEFHAYIWCYDLHAGMTSKEILDKAWEQVKMKVNNYVFWHDEFDKQQFTELVGTKYTPAP